MPKSVQEKQDMVISKTQARDPRSTLIHFDVTLSRRAAVKQEHFI